MVVLDNMNRSDSNQTLVSLGNHKHSHNNAFKRVGSLELLQQAYPSASADDEPKQPQQFVETCLYLPRGPDEEEPFEFLQQQQQQPRDEEDYWGEAVSTDVSSTAGSSFYDRSEREEDEASFHSCSSDDVAPIQCLSSALPQQQEPLYLPSSDSDVPVDDCLGYLPSLVERNEALLSKPVQAFGATNQDKFLYVGQGEVGHAVPLQTNVILSDRATTCHIVMLYSSSGTNVPLASCAHIDGPHYDKCLKEMFDKHAQHHRRFSGDSSEDEDMVEMDIHISGGLDQDELSKSLTSWLLRQLADLAESHKHDMRCTLQTACVSSLNATASLCGGSSPLVRGLGLNLRTGEVFCACVPDLEDAGPNFALRQARLWSAAASSSSSSNHQLSQVHRETTNVYEIAPFCLPKFLPEQLNLLIQLDDEALLRATSTSPHAEDDTFCQGVRATLHVLLNPPLSLLSGSATPLRFKRRPTAPNAWVEV